MTLTVPPRKALTAFVIALAMTTATAACGSKKSSNESTEYGSTTTAAAGASTTSAGGAAAVATDKVDIKGFAFKPQAITVAVGTKVTWTNGDGFDHTVTADDGSFDAGHVASGKTFEHTFDKAGTFAYHCNIHNSMTGTVTVH